MKTTKKAVAAEEPAVNKVNKTESVTALSETAEDTAYLTVTDRIEADTVKYIAKGIKEKFGCDNVVCKADNSITGGFTVRYKGMLYDMSIASQLSQIKNSLIDKED